MLLQRGLEKTRLRVVHPIARRVLLRRAIEQHFLQFLHRAGINHRHFSVFQSRVILAGQDQPLDFRRRKFLAAAGREDHAEIKPLHARRRDLKLRLDALDVFQRAVFQLLVERDVPFALQPGKFAGEKIQNRILSGEQKLSFAIRRGESAALQAGQRVAFANEIAGGIARDHFRIGQPDGFGGGRHTERHDAQTVGALQPRAELREAAFQFEQECWRLRFEREIFRFEICLDALRRRQLRPLLA